MFNPCWKIAVTAVAQRARQALVVCAGLCSAVNLYYSAQLIFQAHPVDPWESQFVVEGAQTALGESVYGSVDPGSATHMYGPLLHELLGVVFPYTGVGCEPARIVSFVTALIGIALLLRWAMPRWKTARVVLYASLLLCTQNYAMAYFAVGKPDMLAFLLALLGMATHAQALRERSFLFLMLATGLFLTVFFCKQNLAAFALVVPFGYALAVAARADTIQPGRLLIASIPAAGVAAAVALMRMKDPVMYFYLIEIAAAHPIPWQKLVEWAARALGMLAIIWAVLAAILTRPRDVMPATWGANDFHKVSALAVAFVICTASAAKYGGAENSLLPFLLLLVAATIHGVERTGLADTVLDKALSPEGRAPRVLAILLVVGLFVTLYPSKMAVYLQRSDTRAESYRAVIDHVSRLEGHVLSIEDPTITLRAGKPAGFNYYVERDRERTVTFWGRWPTPAILDRLAEAAYVVEVKFSFWEVFDQFIAPMHLPSLGYAKVWENRHYAVWGKSGFEAHPLPVR